MPQPPALIPPYGGLDRITSAFWLVVFLARVATSCSHYLLPDTAVVDPLVGDLANFYEDKEVSSANWAT
jgi:hypothetical protein